MNFTTVASNLCGSLFGSASSYVAIGGSNAAPMTMRIGCRPPVAGAVLALIGGPRGAAARG